MILLQRGCQYERSVGDIQYILRVSTSLGGALYGLFLVFSMHMSVECLGYIFTWYPYVLGLFVFIFTSYPHVWEVLCMLFAWNLFVLRPLYIFAWYPHVPGSLLNGRHFHAFLCGSRYPEALCTPFYVVSHVQGALCIDFAWYPYTWGAFGVHLHVVSACLGCTLAAFLRRIRISRWHFVCNFMSHLYVWGGALSFFL